MAFFYKDPSRTFSEYLLIPGYSSKDCVPENVSLKTPITKFNLKNNEESELYLNIPMASAIMQAVSDDRLAIALAREGGISFIYCSQSIESQAEMISKVKNFKAGFVKSDSNLSIDSTLKDVIELKKATTHSTMAVTDNKKPNGKLLRIVKKRDYRLNRMPLTTKALSQANDVLWEHKLNSLPIVDENGNLCYFVFRKDYDSHKRNPNELLDSNKRFVVGAGINTHDYKERVPALVEAGADVLCIDSSEGFTEWQKETIKFVKEKYNNRIKVGAGNVVNAEGFRFLADCGADFIKVGIGGGSICITRETKGIGRGQATALIDVCEKRNEYCKETGIYIPICSDGGIVHDYHITLALAMGADFVMLGRYFARFNESPSNKVSINGNYMKEYWGEGSNRAKNWQRYETGKLTFEEGVDSYVPYAGSLHNNIIQTTHKIKSTMCNCGFLDIASLQKNAKLTVVSATSIVEGGAHDVILKNKNTNSIQKEN